MGNKAIAICGANGYVGRNACKFFSANGFKVIGLIRDSHQRNIVTVNNAEPLVVDYNDVNTLSTAMSNVFTVVDLVGSGSQSPDETYEHTNVMTTRNIVKASENARVSKFIYFSGLGTRRSNTNVYFISRFLAEQIIIKSSLDFTIFRPSYIIGKGDSFTSRLLKQIKEGVVEVYGSGEYRLQPIYIEDVMKILLKTLDNRNASRQLFDLVGPEPISFLDYVDMLSKQLSLNPRKNFLGLEETLQEIMRMEKPPVSFDNLIVRICDEISDHKPLETVFDVNLSTPSDAVKTITLPDSRRLELTHGEELRAPLQQQRGT